MLYKLITNYLEDKVEKFTASARGFIFSHPLLATAAIAFTLLLLKTILPNYLLPLACLGGGVYYLSYVVSPKQEDLTHTNTNTKPKQNHSEIIPTDDHHRLPLTNYRSQFTTDPKDPNKTYLYP